MSGSQRRLHQDVWVWIGRDKHSGVVEGINLPNQPPGVLVRFVGGSVNGLDTCYATHDEVRARYRPRQREGCKP